MKTIPMSRKTLATISYALTLAKDTSVWLYATAMTSQGGLGLDSDLAWKYIAHAQSRAISDKHGNAPAGTFSTEDAARFQAFQEKRLSEQTPPTSVLRPYTPVSARARR